MIVSGSVVTWESQSRGSWKTKTGKLLGYCQPRKDGKAFVPKGTSGSRIKFQSRSEIERVIVEVPRGGKSDLFDYFAPRSSQIKLVQD